MGVKVKLDKFGQLPMGLSVYLFDNVQDITVNTIYLEMVLKRLHQLEQIAPDHIAKANIPMTIDYLLSVVPDKVLNRYKVNN